MPASRLLRSKQSAPLKRLVENSRVVFRLCALPNGGIVAARSDLPDYPKDIQPYDFVWPRDAALVCAAARRVGIHTIQRPFWRWLVQRAEGLHQGRPLNNVFYPNGEAAGVLLAGSRSPTQQVQWDALGILLWAIEDEQQFVRRLSPAARLVAQRVATAIEKAWTGRSFRGHSWDIWEEQLVNGNRGEVHTYSLAITLRGLEAAETVLGSSRSRQKTVVQMRRRLEQTYSVKHKMFARTVYAAKPDLTADMSLLGLVWPSQQVAADDPRFAATLTRLLKRCQLPTGGYRRYANDRYSGVLRNGRIRPTGAGAWPWLSAWLSVVLMEQGKMAAATRELNWLMKQSRGHVLPEQFRSDGQPSVPGLAASHAMAILAADRLGVLPRS